jgi:glycine/D-amino acid oxidase-like deaminating enzyme
VLATNAHTRHLLPEHPIAHAIYPVRSQMALITPPPGFAGNNAVRGSYGIGSPYAIVAGSCGMVFGQGALGWTSEGVRVDEVIDNTEDWKLFDNDVGTECELNLLACAQTEPVAG